MEELILRYRSIAVFKNAAAAASPAVALISAKSPEEKLSAAAELFYRVADAGCDSVGEFLEKQVKFDDNFFSRAVARGERISPRVKAQAESELTTFKLLSAIRPDDYADESIKSFFPMFGAGGFSLTYSKLVAFYASTGCGVFSRASAFIYTDGAFIPTETEPVHLSDLKNYAEEKAEIVKNTENFIAGLPAFHTLLYGDRGTGKSTTVRALAYEYRDKLKVVELPKAELINLPKLFAALDGYKQKFIIFADDISFEEDDECAGGFKAALEGSISTCGNALLYCTSNRRHLIKETDKQERRNDDIQEKMSLFDRFGLVVTYINPDKAEFLDIFKQILRSRGIKWRDEYASIAELAALKKGGRSPRAAKQIADLIQATYAEAEKR